MSENPTESSTAAWTAPPGPGQQSEGRPRPWFKKKRYLIPGGFLSLSLIGGMLPEDKPATANKASSTATSVPSTAEEAPLTEAQRAALVAKANQEAAKLAAAEKAAAAAKAKEDAARARLHTKLETPFFTGGMKSVADIVASLP